MTLIATVISSLGIIQASDSNLTGGGLPVEAGQKVFKLGFADGALAVAGAYSVGAQDMDVWLPQFITDYASTAGPSLGGFAHDLADELQTSSTADEARLFHIAGYVDGPGGLHPEFYFVRNIETIDATTGNYEDVTSTYQVTEDFWNRDYLTFPPGVFAASGASRYFNGFPSGRIAYVAAMQLLGAYYEQVWSHPSWMFRRPSSISELATFVRLEMETVNALFASSDYPTPYIGGEIQIEAIAPPHGAIPL